MFIAFCSLASAFLFVCYWLAGKNEETQCANSATRQIQAETEEKNEKEGRKLQNNKIIDLGIGFAIRAKELSEGAENLYLQLEGNRFG